jgi:excisionase family DNA binding protein
MYSLTEEEHGGQVAERAFDEIFAPKQFLSIREAAQYLNVEYKTLYRLVVAGKIPASRVGGVYRIKKQDIDDYLENQKGNAAANSIPSCERCHRLIKSPEMVGGQCVHPGCEALLCRDCWAKESDRYCLEHRLSSEDKLAQAKQKLRAGELTLVVTAAEARQNELDFVGRFDQKIRKVKEVISPVDGTAFRVNSWEDIHSETAEIEIPNNTSKDRELAALTAYIMPRNQRSTYSFLKRGTTRSGASGFVIEAVFFAHLRNFIEDGFDTLPVSHTELVWLLETSIASAKNRGALYVVGFASPTGWTDEAREAVAGKGSKKGFSSLYGSFCLINMNSDKLIANPYDMRIGSFLDVFRGDLDEEVINHVVEYLQAQFLSRESQELEEVADATEANPKLVEEAFRRLERSGRFVVSESGRTGLTIVRKTQKP